MTSYWNGSAWADFVSPSTDDSATLSTTITDSLGKPKKAMIRISNQSVNPFANSGSSKGPYTGVIGDFTPIKMRDGDTNEVIFYGFAEKTAETYQQGLGMVIDIDAVDHLQLLSYNRTTNAYSYNINPSSAVLADSIRNTDTKDDDKEEWTKNVSGRSGLIKSLLNQFAQDITHPSSTDADVADDRFTESVKEFTENQVYNLSDRGKKSVLFHISDLSEKDPHSASGDQDYGYDYYLDANMTTHLANDKPFPYFNYFKRATRPATNPATYGLSITLPNPDDTSGGSFTQTGQKIAMTEYDFKRPKSGVFSEADVDFVTTQGEDNKSIGLSSKFELVTIHTSTNVSSFRWSGYELGGNTSATAEKLKVAVATLDGSVGASGTTFNLNEEDITDNFYIGQKVSLSGSEILTVNAIPDGETLTLNRSQEGTTASGTFVGGTTLYMRDVARIQYTSGTADVDSSGTTYALISDIDKSLTEDLDNEVWKTGGDSKLWAGQTTTGSSFKLKGRPRITLGVKKTVSISNDSEKKNAVREQIAAALMRNTTQTVEADIKTYETPKFYFDNSPSGVVGTAVTLNGINPQSYGFKAGMTVVKLDSSGTPTTTYGYASAVSSTVVTVTMSGSISASDTLRYIVPVRAGDIIQVRNDLVNFNGYMLVTNISADMSAGVNLTRFQALGSENAKEAAYGKVDAIKRIADFVSTDHSRPPNLPFAANPADSVTTCEFTSTTANQVNWAAGRITVNGNIYNITAGNTGALNADGREYYVYVTQGSTTFTTVEIDSFVPDEKTLIVAHVRYDSPEAFFSVICRELNFKPFKVSADGTIQKFSVSAQLQKKGTQPWSTSVVFSGTDYDSFAWASGALSFADDDTEAVSSGSRDMSAATEYVYKIVGDSANATLQVTATYTDVFDDDKVLLATVARSTDSGAGGPTILPFNGNVLTISAGAIAANSIVAANIKAGSITTSELNFTPATNTSDKTAGTVGGWKLNSTNIYSGSSAVTSGYSSAADITLTSSGTIHAKQFYIDGSGNANFKGSISGASGTFTGSLTGATGTFGNCSMGTDGFVADGELLGFQIMNGSTHYGAIGYTTGALTISTTDNDASTVTARMYFNDAADPIVQIPPGTSAEINEHQFIKYSYGGSEYANMFPVGDRDGTAGDPYGYIGVNGSHAQAPYARIFADLFHPSDGTAGAPSISFMDNNDTGIYSDATNSLAISTAGAQRFKVNSNGITAPINATSGTGGMEALYIDVTTLTNRFHRLTSSKRYKENIRNLEIDTSHIYDLRPVNYTSKNNKTENFGLIAEEVDKYLPELITYNEKGQPDSVAYTMLSVLLLNEVQKIKKELDELKEAK